MRKEKIVEFQGRASKGARFFLVFIFVLFSYSHSHSSGIDAHYKLRRSLPASAKSSKNEVLSLYRGFLSRSMYSRCKWFPSDSQHLQIMSERCGRWRGTLFAFSRFMTENDAHRGAVDLMNDHGHIRFINFKDNCELF